MKVYARKGLHTAEPNLIVSMRCPSCRHLGLFEMRQPANDILVNSDGVDLRLGQRLCPNIECRAQVFVVLDKNGRLVASYPPELVDFDSSDLPEKVVAALEEAVLCHANQCWVAAAMLIRKTLEVFCDKEGIDSGNLKERVVKLGDSSIVPPKLMQGVDNLRLLGNDAAHVKSKDYDNIGTTEIEVALDFTKELLKAVYQYSGIVERLEALKVTPEKTGLTD
jgi:hypothetical protein